MHRLLPLLFAACASSAAEVPPSYAEPVEELGAVQWPRGLPAALARSKASGKPVLALFDEVPGCSTVKGFGTGAVTHPLLAYSPFRLLGLHPFTTTSPSAVAAGAIIPPGHIQKECTPRSLIFVASR